MKKSLIIIFTSFILTYIGSYMYDFSNKKPLPPIAILSGNTITDYTGSVLSGNNGHLTGNINIKLLANSLEIENNKLDENDFPLIKINKPVKNLKITFDVTFTDYFKKYYKGYIDSNGYFFAFKFFLGSQENGGFIDVFRNQNDGVANSINGDLKGAKLGNEITNGTTRVIEGDKLKIAQPSGTYGFTYAYPTQYINSQIGKTIYLGGHLSGVKEMKGWNFTRINQITIEYEGEEGSIELVQ